MKKTPIKPEASAAWRTVLVRFDEDLRRYGAALSERRSAPATVARKLAALRAFFETLREHGESEANPANLLAAPRSGRELPRVLAPDEISRLLDRIPASTPLELRDRALFEI